MTNVIQKYVKLGVLNYIDHETPRNYFLWDWMMEEEPGSVQCLVEDLCDENIAMMKTIKSLEKLLEIYERERERFRHTKPELTGAYFLTGGYGETDSNELPQFVRICPAYGCAWEQVYEKIDKTITYEGS